MNKFLLLAFRNLSRNPSRNFLSAFTIFFGALILLISSFLADGISDGIITNLVAIESGTVMVTFQKSTSDIRDSKVYTDMHKRILKKLSPVVLDSDLRTRLRFDGILFGPSGQSSTLVIKGIDPERETHLKNYLLPTEGRSLSSEGQEIYLSQQAADQLEIKAGDQVTLVLNTWGNQINAMDVTVSGIFANVAPWVDYVAYVSIPTSQSLYAAEMSNQYLISSVTLADAGVIAEKVKSALDQEPVVVRTYLSAGGFQLGIANANRYTFLAFSFLLIFIVGLGIMSLVGITVRERTSEIGMLLSLGFQRFQIFLLFVMEIVILTSISVVIAAIVGYAIYLFLATNGIELSGVARNAFGTAKLFPALHVNQFILMSTVCLLMSFIGAAIPAWNILKFDADEILRKE
jgi:putative ABC transport system permease protein